MVIRGNYRRDYDGPHLPAPFLSSTVYLPRFHIFLDVEFLVDTGAETTVLGLSDVQSAGLHDGDFRQAPRRLVRGVGGERNFYLELASMVFRDDGREVTWGGQVRIPQQSAPGLTTRTPSILGRDLLNLCDLRLNWPAGLIALEPLNVDAGGHILPP